jgi:hypothetical protein
MIDACGWQLGHLCVVHIVGQHLAKAEHVSIQLALAFEHRNVLSFQHSKEMFETFRWGPNPE